MAPRTNQPKRKAHRPPGGVRRRPGGRPGPRPAAAPTLPGLDEDILLRLLGDQPAPLSQAEIVKHLALPPRYQKMLATLLTSLCRQGLLTRTPGAHYRLAPGGGLVTGTLSVHPKGFGFVTPMDAPPGQKIGKDFFVSPRDLASAMHNDRVLVRLTQGGRGDRREARVVAVLARAAALLVGIYTATSRTYGMVTPEDDRYPFTIRVARAEAQDGEAVVVAISDFSTGGRELPGHIVEVLGDPADLLVQTEMTIRSMGLPHRFSAEVAAEVAGLDPAITLEPGRVDLRAVPHVTIDGETARDFDDAVAIEEKKGGWRLYVSIADVGHYVRPGTALDQEAYQRGTSVYFPNKVVPMLPERLSNDLCSLVPGQDRLAFTAIIDFDRKGVRQDMRFTKSVINSRHRLTYTKVKAMVADRDATLLATYADVASDLTRMAALAGQLEKRRLARGSIGFEIPEAAIVIDDQGHIAAVRRLERNLAHKLIEEFMLAANEAVAEALATRQTPTLYRIHEEPDALKVEEFATFTASLGLRLPKGEHDPAWFGKVLAMVAGTPREYLISNLLLRAMQRARYSPDNAGHFGLAAEYYTHFTSPIRRYPDLVVHRVLARQLAPAGKGGRGRQPALDLAAAGLFLSDRERKAMEAEREVVDKLKSRFMAEHLGETFEGIISGVAGFGLFVELLDTFISGAVAMTDLTDDYYQLDEKHHRLIGQRGNRVFQLGDLVRVKVASVDLRRRRINFVPV